MSTLTSIRVSVFSENPAILASEAIATTYLSGCFSAKSAIASGPGPQPIHSTNTSINGALSYALSAARISSPLNLGLSFLATLLRGRWRFLCSETFTPLVNCFPLFVLVLVRLPCCHKEPGIDRGQGGHPNPIRPLHHRQGIVVDPYFQNPPLSNAQILHNGNLPQQHIILR